MSKPGLPACLGLLLTLSLPASAADRIFTGSLERVGPSSISILMPDGLRVDAVKLTGIPVPYQLADQVELTCTSAKTVYDATAGLHDHLQLKSIRLVRTATPEERAAMTDSLSWRRGATIPIATVDQSELDRVRQVNLEYAAKLPDFVADEINRRYRSYEEGKPWRLEKTIEDEITVKDNRVSHQNVRGGRKPQGMDFGLHLISVFDLRCPTKIEFAGREEAGGKPILMYFFSSPPDACFGAVVHNGNRFVPGVMGRILVDATKGAAIRCEWEGSDFPEKFACDRVTMTDSWAYVAIGGSSYLVPISTEAVLRMSDGSMARMTTEYTNHRHFEASTNLTFH
jgi:hypothetical protein